MQAATGGNANLRTTHIKSEIGHLKRLQEDRKEDEVGREKMEGGPYLLLRQPLSDYYPAQIVSWLPTPGTAFDC